MPGFLSSNSAKYSSGSLSDTRILVSCVKKVKFAEGEESDDDAIDEKLEDSTKGDFDPTGAKKRSVDGKSQT